MNRKIIVIVLLIGLVIACDSVKKLRDPMKAFDDANRAYRQAISWSEFVVAATFLKKEDEEKKEEQIEHLNQFKVTAYELRNITVIEEDVRIRQVVKISYFKRDNLVVKSIADDQLWEYDPEQHTWHILSGFPKFK
jgi:Sec-independent protein translocase protein TatA